jgi:hypothetical protein
MIGRNDQPIALFQCMCRTLSCSSL